MSLNIKVKFDPILGKLRESDETEIPTIEETYTNETPTPIAVGGIAIGETFSEQTNEDMWNRLLYPELFPTFTNPSNTFTMSITGYREIGEIIPTITFSSGFNRGTINPSYNTSGFRSGLPNTYNYTGTDLPSNVYSVLLTDSQSISNYTVIIGTQTWTSSISYDEGEQPLSSIGNDYDSPYPLGTTSSISRTINGVYPYFSTTLNINTMTKQTLVAHGSTITTDFVSENEANKQSLEIPDIWGVLSKIEQWNPLSSSWDNILLSSFTESSIQNIIQGNNIDYNKFTHNGSLIGSRRMRFTF